MSRAAVEGGRRGLALQHAVGQSGDGWLAFAALVIAAPRPGVPVPQRRQQPQPRGVGRHLVAVGEEFLADAEALAGGFALAALDDVAQQFVDADGLRASAGSHIAPVGQLAADDIADDGEGRPSRGHVRVRQQILGREQPRQVAEVLVLEDRVGTAQEVGPEGLSGSGRGGDGLEAQLDRALEGAMRSMAGVFVLSDKVRDYVAPEEVKTKAPRRAARSARSRAKVLMVAGVGAVGYAMSVTKFEAAPMLLGFVLGPLMEENLRRALLLSRGDMMTFVDRPISAGLLAFGAALMIWTIFGSLKRNLREREHRRDFPEETT